MKTYKMNPVQVLLLLSSILLSGFGFVSSQILSDYSDEWTLNSDHTSNQVQNEIKILSDAVAGLSLKQVLLYDKMVNLSHSAIIMNVTSRKLQHELESMSDDVLNVTLQQLTIRRKLSNISQNLETIHETTEGRLNNVASVLLEMTQNQTLFHASLQNVSHQSARTKRGLLYLSAVAVNIVGNMIQNISQTPQLLMDVTDKVNALSTSIIQLQTNMTNLEINSSCSECPECCSVSSIGIPQLVDHKHQCPLGIENPKRWCRNVREQVMRITGTEMILFYDKEVSRKCAFNLTARLPDCSHSAVRTPGLKYACIHL